MSNNMEINALTYEYLACRANSSGKGDLVSWWHWAYKTHPQLYSRLVARIKVDDPDVDRVRQRLLREGH